MFKTRIDYHMIITEISKKQGLGTLATEMPLIIHTETIYAQMLEKPEQEEDINYG